MPATTDDLGIVKRIAVVERRLRARHASNSAGDVTLANAENAKSSS